MLKLKRVNTLLATAVLFVEKAFAFALGTGSNVCGELWRIAMTYWRMQLHPSESGEAVRHTVESLAAGYIGLDFATDIGDMTIVGRESLPSHQRDYFAFAHEMDADDRVLIFAHHFPFALAKVVGPYNFIRVAAPEIGVWFRHFREVEDVWYYGDLVTNAREWQPITMTATITPLRDPTSQSYQLIERWLASRP